MVFWLFKEEAGAELDAGELEAPCGHPLGLAPPRKHKKVFIFNEVLMTNMDMKWTWNPALRLSSWARASEGLFARHWAFPSTTLFSPVMLPRDSRRSFVGVGLSLGKTPVYLCIPFPSLHSAQYSLDLMDSVRHCAPNLIFVWNLGTELFTLCHNLWCWSNFFNFHSAQKNVWWQQCLLKMYECAREQLFSYIEASLCPKTYFLTNQIETQFIESNSTHQLFFGTLIKPAPSSLGGNHFKMQQRWWSVGAVEELILIIMFYKII